MDEEKKEINEPAGEAQEAKADAAAGTEDLNQKAAPVEKAEAPAHKNVWKWWPHLVLLLGAVMLAVMFAIGFLSERYPVPDDAPDVIPYPDDGENIPGPEWLFLLFWLPFWYFKGRMKKYLFLTALVPIIGLIWLIFMPYYHKIPFDKIPGLKWIINTGRAMKSGFMKSFVYSVPVLIIASVLWVSVYKAGHQAKVLGCDSCHNPAMGHRMSIPPADVAKYYQVERAMQIGIGKYRAGKSFGVTQSGAQVYTGGGEAEGYKDADWQLRHMYEPTFTW